MKLKNWKEGILIVRYKRFLADVQLADGEVVTVHCPNSGTMKTCWQKGDKVIITKSDNLKRKLAYTLELIYHLGSWIGVNTHRANRLVEEALLTNCIESLQDVEDWQREKKYGNENSRIDFLGKQGVQQVFVEVKNVTYQLENDKVGQFPDSKTERGQKHLRELTTLVKQGQRAVLLLVIQRQNVKSFKVAEHIDLVYYDLFIQAINAGVEVLPCLTKLTKDEIIITGEMVNYEL